MVRPELLIRVRLDEELGEAAESINRQGWGGRSRGRDDGDERVGDAVLGRGEADGEGENLDGADEVQRGRLEGDGRAWVVRVDIEKGVGLGADKVVRRGGAAAGDPDGLGEAEDALRK